MATIIKDLGPISAYAYAVTQGYTGTEEEFAELMASYASVAETAVEAAETATTKASEASTSAGTASTAATTATTKAAEATTAAGTASTAAQTATTKAQEANTSAGTAAQNATTAVTKASEAAQSATSAASAQTAAEAAQTAAEAAQTAAETAEANAEAEADRAEGYADRFINVYPTDTASGSIASFPDGADGVPVKSLVVNVEPVQDLHGYDNPWPAGGGKNLLHLMDGTYAIGSTGATAIISDGKLTLTGTATTSGGRTTRLSDYFTLKAGTYIVSPTKNTSPYVRGYINNRSDDSALGYSSGYAITISEDTEVYYGIGVEGGNTYNEVVYPQVESGSTISSYAPYSNLCPITGWTGANVTAAGENLFDLSQVYTGAEQSVSGTTISKGSTAYSFDMLNGTTGESATVTKKIFLKSGTYAISGTYTGDGVLRVYQVGDDNKVITTPLCNLNASVSVNTFTLTADGYITLRYSNREVATVANLQINIGTATAYEPYNGTTKSISFPSTIYGGTDEVVSGSGKNTKKYVLLNNPDAWIVSSSSSLDFQISSSVGPKFEDRKHYANSYDGLVCSYATADNTKPTYVRWSGANSDIFGIKSDTLTLAQIKADAEAGKIAICYDVATPEDFSTIPVTIESQYGQNNIWSDTGDTSVTYRADIQLYIDKLTGSTEDDMTADSNIPNNTYFLVGNTLYKSTAAIEQGATIAPGTNCTKTDLAAALNALQ